MFHAQANTGGWMLDVISALREVTL